MAQSRIRRGIAVALFFAGLALFGDGVYLETRNPRSNAEDDVALCVLAAGVALITIGTSLPFLPIWAVALIGIVSPFAAFGVAVIVFWMIVMLNAVFRFGL
jgi:hypothetical protein